MFVFIYLFVYNLVQKIEKDRKINKKMIHVRSVILSMYHFLKIQLHFVRC
jgi:hypothetical protein